MEILRRVRGAAFALVALALLLSLPTFSHLAPQDRAPALSPFFAKLRSERAGALQPWPGRQVTLPAPPVQENLKLEAPRQSDASQSIYHPIHVPGPGEPSIYDIGAHPGLLVAEFDEEGRAQLRRAYRLGAPGGSGFSGSGGARRGGESGSELQELLMLEQTYHLAFNHLFSKPSPAGPQPIADNPFREALAQQMNLPEPAADLQSVAKQPGTASPPPPKDSTPLNNAVSTVVKPVEGEEKPHPGPFDFLLIGELSRSRRVFRAFRDGATSFTLDNSTRFVLPSRGFLGFEEGDYVLTADLTGDGVVDLVAVRRDFRGSLVDIYAGKGGTQFQRLTSFLIRERITGLASFELSGDQEEDLVMTLAGSAHLFVYEQTGGQFRYLKELVLPFVPALLAEAQTEGSRRLYVFEAAGSQVVSLSAEKPGVFLSGDDPVRSYLKTLQLDSLARNYTPVELVVLDYGGRITLAERTAAGLLFYGSFSTLQKMPLLIVGDYLFPGRKQILFGP